MIRVDGLKKSFNDELIFLDASLKISDAGLYVIMGPSGSGKSTLLNILAKTEKIDAGQVEVRGRTSFILQSYELIDELNVYDNIFLFSEPDKQSLEWIKKLGLEPLLKRNVKELSGGQRQRVGIIRALNLDPDIIFCDEPLEALDVHNKKIVIELLKELSKEKIVLMVTHDEKLAKEYADVIYLLKDHKINKVKDLNIKRPLKDTKKSVLFDAGKVINEVFKKHNIIYMAAMILIALMCVLLLGFSEDLFVMKESSYLNKDVYYLSTKSEEILENYDLKMIIPFKSLESKGKEYSASIYPLDGDDLKNEGLGVIINENLAQEAGLKKGDEVGLSYDIFGQKKSLNAEIIDVILEDGTYIFSVYYDLDNYLEYFKNKEITSTFNVYDYFLNFGSVYEYHYPYEDYEDLSLRLKSLDKDIEITQPLYDERAKIKKEGAIYRLIFVLALAFMGLLCVMGEAIYLGILNKSFKRISAIFVSLGQDLKMLKKAYTTQKRKSVFSSLGLSLIIALILISILKLGKLTLWFMIALFTILSLVYLIVSLIFKRTLKSEELAKSLKDN